MPRISHIQCQPDIYDNVEKAEREGDIDTRGGMLPPKSQWFADLAEGSHVVKGVYLPPDLFPLLSAKQTYTFTLKSDWHKDGIFLLPPQIVTVEQNGKRIFELKATK